MRDGIDRSKETIKEQNFKTFSFLFILSEVFTLLTSQHCEKLGFLQLSFSQILNVGV